MADTNRRIAGTPHLPVQPSRSPVIHSVRTGPTEVETADGSKNATRVIIVGDHFAIRAIEPLVTAGGVPLNRFTISNDLRSIDGYLIGTVGTPTQVVVDYGWGLRAEWNGEPMPIEEDTVPVEEIGEGAVEPPLEALSRRLPRLTLLLLFITLAIVIGSLLVGMGGPSLQFLGWLALGAAGAMALLATVVSITGADGL